MEVTQGVRLPAEAAAACYSRFESVVEGALGQLDALFVRAIWKDHRLNLYLSVETGADLKAVCPAAVQEAPGSHPADPFGPCITFLNDFPQKVTFQNLLLIAIP